MPILTRIRSSADGDRSTAIEFDGRAYTVHAWAADRPDYRPVGTFAVRGLAFGPDAARARRGARRLAEALIA